MHPIVLGHIENLVNLERELSEVSDHSSTRRAEIAAIGRQARNAVMNFELRLSGDHTIAENGNFAAALELRNQIAARIHATWESDSLMNRDRPAA